MLVQFAQQALVILLPLFLAALSLGVAALVPVVRKHVKNALAADAIDALAGFAATSAADAAQRVVADLKDPSKPGAWDAKAAAAVKASVIADVKALGSHSLAYLLSHGMTPAAVDTLLSQLVEESVADLKSRGVATTIAVSAAPLLSQPDVDSAVKRALDAIAKNGAPTVSAESQR